MTLVFTSVIALTIGALTGFIAGRRKLSGLPAEIAARDERIRSLEREIAQTREDSDKRMAQLREDFSLQLARTNEDAERRLECAREDHRRQLEENRRQEETRMMRNLEALEQKFGETVGRVEAQMKNAADEMLRSRQQEFSRSSREDLGRIVDPLKETIERMKQTMSDTTLRQTDMSAEMKANIEAMIKISEAAMKSTDQLARVFRHGSKAQGDWGETVLSELLESQGLTPGIHYDIQTTIRDADGQTVRTDSGSSLRPDVILHLDSRREVVIDSKVSMSAFIDYVNAETEQQRETALNAHIESIRKHVRELALKDYSSYIRPPKVRMSYVIMFMPNTGALWTALRMRPDLWRKAMEQNVYIADEQTLFAALKIISMTWTQIAQARNHEKVYALADEMLDRVGQFVKKYQAVGKALDSARKAYDEGEKKLQPQGQSILTTCAKLQRLGARQSDRNPIAAITSATDSTAGDNDSGILSETPDNTDNEATD